MDEQLEFAKEIASRLDSAGIPYMITGSVATAVYAVPRMTRDIDFVIECEPSDAERIAALFAPDCYVDTESIRAAASRRSMFNIVHTGTIVKADFIVRKDTEYRKLEFSRRRRMDVEGASLSVVAPEDLILSKLFWARDTESDMQRRDAKALLTAAPELDRRYLEKWADELGVKDLLDEAAKG